MTEIAEAIRADLELICREYEIPVTLKNIVVYGSRSKGYEHEDSDLDILVEYEGDFREDELFALFHDSEEPLQYHGIPVDVNPIRAEESGTIETYLPAADAFLEHQHMIQTAFAQVRSQFNLTASQQKFSRHLEKFAILEQLDSDLISAAFERSHNFRRIYGSVQLLSKRIFAGRLNRFSEALQNAIDRVLPRFPSFAVRIRRGLFWYYLEPNTAPGPFLKADVANPCQPVRFREDNGWLVRFYYYRNRISLEVFHALSDGAGALIFFRTLLAEYLRQTGISVPAGNGVLDLEEPPRKEELEDAYARYAGRHALGLRRMPKAYANTGTPEPFYTFHVTMGFVPLGKLREAARSYDASITEYLSAVLIHVLLEKQRREHPHKERPVALAVPINLRSWFPSETVRNFITTVRPSIDPALGDYTFPEIVSQVRHYMKLHVHRQELQASFTGNVRFTKNFFLRAVPVFLKNPVMALNYYLLGVRPYSCTYTNPGAFTVPPEMAPHIQGMEVVLGQATVPRCHCASISYGDIMEITFAGTQAETDTERDFFRFLVREGIPVRIESNR